jgi:hypothetical protein
MKTVVAARSRRGLMDHPISKSRSKKLLSLVNRL